MLTGVPGILSPDMLKVLCEMGHGDSLVIADGNFPAESVGKLPLSCGQTDMESPSCSMPSLP